MNISYPPYILVETNKTLHGWWPGKRECTAERMLINPYNGCSVGCWFCYSLSLPGRFQQFRRTGTIYVAKNFADNIARQLDSLDFANCGYLSPVTDPFQSVNNLYRLSEKIVRIFIERNIPIEFITKSVIPPEVIELITEQKHSFGQVSILTGDENIRKLLVPQGASTEQLFQNLTDLAKYRIYAICRIDPILPYITDVRQDLTDLIYRAKESGARHIIASILDIPLSISTDIFQQIGYYWGTERKKLYRQLYTERIGYLNAELSYRRKIFTHLREQCDKYGLTFALCMEYEKYNSTGADKTVEYRGLNREFMSSLNCEGIDVPLYHRRGNKFYPAADCPGNCLNCQSAVCGIPELAMGKPGSKKAWRLADYRRWTKTNRVI